MICSRSTPAIPRPPEAEEAWLEAADIAWFDLGDPRQAIDIFVQFVETLPASPSAPQALLSAGRAAEISGDLPGAVDLYARASASYPASDLASRAALRSGLTQFRLQDVSGAAASFQRAGELAQVGADRAAAAYWSGKVLASQGLTAESEQAWASAAANDPTGFYSERAADVLAGRGPFEPAGVFSFPIDLGGDRSQAEEWLRTTFPITAAGDLSGLNESSAGDPRMVRGTELLALGLYDEARAEFEDLRLDYSGDAEFDLPPNASFPRPRPLRCRHPIRPRRCSTWPGWTTPGILSAPRYFNLIRFGPYFGDLILPEAAAAGLDPLFLLSVVRQESLFQGAATSSASARGLMQVIPTTGAAIVAELGWPAGYSEADLHRPLRLGPFRHPLPRAAAGTCSTAT